MQIHFLVRGKYMEIPFRISKKTSKHFLIRKKFMQKHFLKGEKYMQIHSFIREKYMQIHFPIRTMTMISKKFRIFI